MIVGEFNDSYAPCVDGVGNVVRNYAMWLDQLGHECHVAVPGYPNYTDNEPFDIIRCKSVGLPFKRPYRLGIPEFDYEFRKKIFDIPFDIIHAHSPFSTGEYARRLAHERGVPLVATFHSKYYDDFKGSLKSTTLAKIALSAVVDFYERADFVFAVNEPTVGVLRDYGYKGDVSVLNNGCEYDAVEDVEPLRRIFNEKHHVSQDEIVMLFVGQHIQAKNIRLILKACAILKSNGIRFRLFTAGEGKDMGDCIELARELGIADVTTFLGKILDRGELQTVFARADLFLFPSVYDNAPIVMMEAASVKCPALVISGTNSAAGIKDGYNGFFGPASVAGYARRIADLIENPAIMKYAGENAQKTVYVPWKTRVEELCILYEDLIKIYKQTAGNPKRLKWGNLRFY